MKKIHLVLVCIILVICSILLAGFILNHVNAGSDDVREVNMTQDKYTKSSSFEYFKEIVKVPRPNGYMDKIQDYLEEFSKVHNLTFIKDETGNVIIRNKVSGTPITLQGHMDIVAVSTNNFDFKTQSIPIVIKDGWVSSEGTTTLGADDGAGISVMLYALTCDELKNTPIECLFTVDEEGEMTGAHNLSPDALLGDVCINIDGSDPEDVLITIGCAGYKTSISTFQKNHVAPSGNWYTISVSNLRGGHSGVDINTGRANAILLIADFLNDLPNLQVGSFAGGLADNAIPSFATATFSTTEDIKSKFEAYEKKIRETYKTADPNLKITLTDAETPAKAFGGEFIVAIANCTNGVVHENEVGVITSTNLGIVRENGDTIEVIHSSRSADESELDELVKEVTAAMQNHGATVTITGSAPGWLLDTNSTLLKTTSQAYEEIFGKKPRVVAIHAGLECGILSEKYPNMEVISIGARIIDEHMVSERMEIASLDGLERYVVKLVKEIKTQK